MSQRNDLEYQWLIDNGADPAQLNDMWFQVLRAWGYTGALDDMQHDYWAGGGIPGPIIVTPPIVIIENGVTIIARRNPANTLVGYRLSSWGVLIDPPTFPELLRVSSRKSDKRFVIRMIGDYTAETLTGLTVTNVTDGVIRTGPGSNFESFDGTYTTFRWDGLSWRMRHNKEYIVQVIR